MRHTIGSIHMSAPIHVQSMKMETSRLVAKAVFDVDNQLVALGDCDGWYWPLAIDAHDRAILLTVRVRMGPSNIEVVGDCGSLHP